MTSIQSTFVHFDNQPRRILHVDMDAFFVSVELLKRPDLRGKPVIVGGNSPRGVVSTCSYEARKYGIHSAMPSVQANRLCPHAIWVQSDFNAYNYYSRQVFNIMRRYSPDVYQLSVDEGRVDLTGSQALFGSAERIAHRILEEIRNELGLPASGGLANSGTAAKMVSEFAKPGGLAIVMPGMERRFLAPLPVEAIPGVGKKGLPKFHQHGIRTIGDIAAFDPDQLHKIFGQWANSLLKIATGQSKRIQPHSPASPSRSNECTFSKNISDPDQIRQELRRLVEKLGYRLRRSNLKSNTISVKIRDAHFRTITRSRKLSEPTNRDNILFKEAERLLMANLPISGGVRLIGVAAQNLATGVRQASLFEQRQPKDERFYKAVDTIKDKYGRHSVAFGTPPGWRSTAHRTSQDTQQVV